MANTYFSLEEAASYIKISKSSLYKLTHKRLIPFFKPGGKIILFLKDDLDVYILASRQETLKTSISTHLQTLKSK